MRLSVRKGGLPARRFGRPAPASAQRFVKRNQIGSLALARLRQLVLSIQQRALRRQHIYIGHQPHAIL